MTWNQGDLPIHDHFDGSANCVECNGPCQLVGTGLFLTQLVREMVTAWDLHGQNPAYMVELVFEKRMVYLKDALKAYRSVDPHRGPRIKQPKE